MTTTDAYEVVYRYKRARREGFLRQRKVVVEGTRPMGVLREGEVKLLELPTAVNDAELGSARLSDGVLEIRPTDNASVVYAPEGLIEVAQKVSPLQLGESHVHSVITRGDAGVFTQDRNRIADLANGVTLRRVKERA